MIPLAALSAVLAFGHGLHPTALDGTDPHRGVMFDLEALEDLDVLGLALNLPATDTYQVDVYSRQGSHVGHEGDPRGWTFLGRGTVTGEGAGIPSVVDLPMVVSLDEGDVVALYMDMIDGTLLVTPGTDVGAQRLEVANAFRVTTGIALEGAFAQQGTPAVFNGGIHYKPTGNVRPFATPRVVETLADSALTVELRGGDANSDMLTMRITREPDHGTLTRVQMSQVWLYTPDPGFTGADTFTFRTHDGELESEDAEMTIEVKAPEPQVPVNRPPVANAGGPYRGREGGIVVLDGSGSTDADGTVQIWRWDCESDGRDDAVGVTARCTYGNDGVYEATLTVGDDQHAAGTATVRVEVTDVAPVVYLSLGEVTGNAVTVEARVVDPGDEALTWLWRFGDGTVQRGTDLSPVTHRYAEPGRYEVTLSVNDGEGGTGDNTLWVTAGAP